MNKPHALSRGLLATLALTLTSAAQPPLDSPGPGYRQQVEKLFPTPDRARDVQIKTAPPIPIFHSSERPTPDFSDPIRLFVPVIPLRASPFWEAPASAVREKVR